MKKKTFIVNIYSLEKNKRPLMERLRKQEKLHSSKANCQRVASINYWELKDQEQCGTS